MSVRSVRISLRREGKVIGSVTLTEGCEPVLVGRAKECALRLPSDDYSASGVHARIFWKRSALMLEDAGSRNGVFHDGVPVKGSVRMTPGAIYAVGRALLTVENLSRLKKKTLHRHHRLEFLNGADAGKLVDIVPHADGKEFDIGLDPSCKIHLNDLLVSRRHAVLRQNDGGECWIEDLGSRNGTFVNGERLAGKARLLKDGDRISVAFFEFRFLDRSVAHTRVHAWLKLGAVSVTLCVMAALYVTWTTTRESVENYMIIAREAASRGNFTGALETLSASRNARDASEFRSQIDALAAQIGVWEKTSALWKDVRDDIAERRLKEARLKIDSLSSGPIDSWSWNPEEASAVKKDVDFAARAVRLYFDCTDAINEAAKDINTDGDVRVRARIGPLEAFLRENGKPAARRAYLAGLLDSMGKLLEELRIVRSGYDAIDGSISKISAADADFVRIYSEFAKVAEDARLPMAVRSYARRQLSPCNAFVKSQEVLDRQLKLLHRLDFEGVRGLSPEFKLPSLDLCTRHVRYSDVRAAYAERHRTLQHESSVLQLMTEGLSASGITVGGRGADIDLFLDPTNLVRALEFDCLARRPPNSRRPAPVGIYDTMFGIEFTYESLRSLPGEVDGRNMRSMRFQPKCRDARQAFNRAEAFVQYFAGDDRRYLQRGELGRYYTQCVRITIERERMVQRFKEYKGTPRAEIVAGYFADFFSPNPNVVTKRILAQRFARLKRELISLGEKYSLEMNPERQLAIRDEIIAKGIPGDAVMHSKWAQKYD